VAGRVLAAADADEFGHGYDSGDIEAGLDDPLVRQEYEATGANYTVIFNDLVKPRLGRDRVVLEIGPGKGSWTRAVLNHHDGVLHVVDRLDVEDMLRARCPGAGDRLRVHQTKSNDYEFLDDRAIDFAFSIGVFVHLPLKEIAVILERLHPKMKPGGEAIIHYSNWAKLDAWTDGDWTRARVPPWFRDHPTHPRVWWTQNDSKTMESIARRTGWNIVCADLDYFGSCSVLHAAA
jgi:SAM-dependent methyltransferase